MSLLGIIASSLKSGFEPLSIPGCELWLDASDTATISLSGSAVTQWNDKSGNSRTFTQGTAANRPASGTRSKNSLNVVDFDGGDFLSSTAAASVWKFLSDSTQHTIFVVATSDNASTYGVTFGNANSGGTIGFHGPRFMDAPTDIANWVTNGSGIIPAAGVIENRGGSYTAGTFVYITDRQKPSDATAANRSLGQVNLGTAYSNNTFTNGPSSSNPTNSIVIGASINNSSVVANQLDGAIGEIIIYNSYLSNGDTTKVQSYLASKWAI
jgi:hypothetical protein